MIRLSGGDENFILPIFRKRKYLKTNFRTKVFRPITSLISLFHAVWYIQGKMKHNSKKTAFCVLTLGFWLTYISSTVEDGKKFYLNKRFSIKFLIKWTIIDDIVRFQVFAKITKLWIRLLENSILFHVSICNFFCIARSVEILLKII